MKHFVAYHNTEKMGRPLHEGEPLRLLTNKPVQPLLHHTVWFITGEGSGSRQYALGSVFRVTEVKDANEDGFTHSASGLPEDGHVFQPPIPIKEMEWFPEVLRVTGNFGLGVQEIKDAAVIAGLTGLAAGAGYDAMSFGEATGSMMTSADIERVFARLAYRRDVRRPPDEGRRGQFRAGWADASERGDIYTPDTLERLTWRNLGYRLGKHFGRQVTEQVDRAFDVLAGLYHQGGGLDDWRSAMRRWMQLHEPIPGHVTESAVSFFELSFGNTRCPQHAWFGIHPSTISLVVGGIYLAAILRSSKDRGFWLLVDQQPPPIEGVEYRPVRSTQHSEIPLLWAHSPSLSILPRIVANDVLWESFGSASEKILSARIASDRDTVQERRKKKRLDDLLGSLREQEGTDQIKLPEEVARGSSYSEGSVQQILVNRYERDYRAREGCIKHYGATCFICGFDFGAAYGEIVEGFIHVHHLNPLSSVGTNHRVDPIQDLRPLCPNCHAVVHRREPPYEIEDVRRFLQTRRRAEGRPPWL